MNDMLQIGPLVVNRQLLLLLLSLVAGWAALRLRLRTFGEAAAPVLEKLVEAGLIVLLVWKFGHVLFSPTLLWQRPLSLLLMTGAAREAGLGLLAAAAYLAYRVRKNKLPIGLLLDLLAYGAVAAVTAYSLAQWRYGSTTDWPWGIRDGYGQAKFHPLNVYMLLIAWIIGYGLWKKASRSEAGTGRLAQHAALGLGIGGLLVSFADVPGESAFFYLTYQQLMFLGLALGGVIFPLLTHNTGRKGLIAMQTNKEEQTGDSLEQRNQGRQNGQSNGKDVPGIDKKLNGPNRPST